MGIEVVVKVSRLDWAAIRDIIDLREHVGQQGHMDASGCATVGNHGWSRSTSTSGFFRRSEDMIFQRQ